MLLALFPLAVANHGTGVWLDPNHHSGHGLAGTRAIGEHPPGVLTMVLTNDGQTWSTIRGKASSEGKTVSFDFSHVGGPSSLVGTLIDGAIEWSDGNKWTHVAFANHPGWGGKPPNDHVGIWHDTRLAMGPPSFAGMRIIAEDPPHVLTIVATDDGRDWYTYGGKCSGKGMKNITVDQSRFGPQELTGVWAGNEANHPGSAWLGGYITWGGHAYDGKGFRWVQFKMPRWLQQGHHFMHLASQLWAQALNHPVLALAPTVVGVALLAAARAVGGQRKALL